MVFPQPLLPTSPTIWPFSIEKLISFNILIHSFLFDLTGKSGLKKRRYKKGDLVKNKGSISWRNQEVLGLILGVTEFGLADNGSQVLKVRWLDPTFSTWQSYYDHSVEIVAEGK